MQPVVSIIIPTYNRSNIIGQTLDSILKQSYKCWECIVVDDGSTDYTSELLNFYCERDSRIFYRRRPFYKPKGANACRNYGFEVSIGDYMQWFDSDDLMVPHKIYEKINRMERRSDLDVCFSPFGFFEKDKFVTEKLSRFTTNDLFRDIVLKRIKIHTSSPLWRRNFLKNKNLFDEQVLKGQELEFFTRIFENYSCSFQCLEKIGTYIRREERQSIMNDYIQNYDSKKAHSFLNVRRNIQISVLERKDKELYLAASNFYLQSLLVPLRFKDFSLVLKHLRFLKRNVIKNDSFLKFQYVTLIGYCKLLNVTKGKGYRFFKRRYYLNVF